MTTWVESALSLIKPFEGCKLKAYLCPAGKPTIGYGETLNVKMGMVWTQKQADDALASRIIEFKNGVLAVCPQLINYPHRLGACVSLAYNIGIRNFQKSSVARYARVSNWKRAAESFLLWNKAGGKVLAGLERRRKAERAEFLKDGV